MIRGQIIIVLSNGETISYANKYLEKKAGVDEDGNPLMDNSEPRILYDRFGKEIKVLNENGEEVTATEKTATPLFDGFPGANYYYTGAGNDTYDDQTRKGKIKGDYEYLSGQLGVAGNTYLRFPEADKKHGDTTELIRKSSTVTNGEETLNKTKIKTDEIVSIKVVESWVSFPYGRESGYNLSKNDPNFLGFRESWERKFKDFDRGPDFNKTEKFDTGYIPAPILSYKPENEEVVVENKEEYDYEDGDYKYVINTLKHGGEVYGYEVYGIKNGKTSATSFLKI